MCVCQSAEAVTVTTNKGCIRDATHYRQARKERWWVDYIPIYVTSNTLPGVRIQIKLTKRKREFYLKSKAEDSKAVFKILDAQLLVKRVRPNPVYLIAHNTALQAGTIAKYNMTRVELKTFTYASGSQSLYIDNTI